MRGRGEEEVKEKIHQQHLLKRFQFWSKVKVSIPRISWSEPCILLVSAVHPYRIHDAIHTFTHNY